MKKEKLSVLEMILSVIGIIFFIIIILILILIKLGIIVWAYNTGHLLAYFIIAFVLDILIRGNLVDRNKKKEHKVENVIDNEKIREKEIKELKEQIIEKEKSELSKALKNITDGKDNKQ